MQEPRSFLQYSTPCALPTKRNRKRPSVSVSEVSARRERCRSPICWPRPPRPAAEERERAVRAEHERAEHERSQRSRERAEQERAEQERAEQERAEREERERAEQERAEQERAEQERAEQECAEREERERAEQEHAEHAEREHAKHASLLQAARAVLERAGTTYLLHDRMSGKAAAAVLQVGSRTTRREVEKATRSVVMKFHPDKLPQGASRELRQDCSDAFMAISRAKDTLLAKL